MSQELDSLDIKISASFEEAIKSIDKLLSRLSQVQSTIGGLDTASIQKAFKPVQKKVQKSQFKTKLQVDTKDAEKAIAKVSESVKKMPSGRPAFTGEVVDIGGKRPDPETDRRPIHYMYNRRNHKTNEIESAWKVWDKPEDIDDKIAKALWAQKKVTSWSHFVDGKSKDYPIWTMYQSNYDKNYVYDSWGAFGKILSAIRSKFDGTSKASRKLSRNLGKDKEEVKAYNKAMKQLKDSMAKGLGKSFNSFGKALSNTFNPLTRFKNQLSSLMKRIKSSRILRATLYSWINGTIKQITNAIKKALVEGSKSLTQFSSSFNMAISNMRSELISLRNAFAVGFSPIIEFVEPWITSLIYKMVDAMNVMNQFFATLLGKKVVQAKHVWEDYASTLDKAGNAQKNLTLGIDELNILGSESGSGSGSTLKPEDMFYDGEASENVNNFVAEFKKAWADADFSDIGSTLSNKLTKMLKHLNDDIFPDVKEFANKLAKSIATGLNGFITPELFGEVGDTIANALNTRIGFSLTFAENFDFYNFGVSLATAVNHFFETFDFGQLADSLNAWVDGLKDALSGFLNTVSLSDVVSGATDFLKGLETDTIVFLFSGALFKVAGKILTSSLFRELLVKKIVGDSGWVATAGGLGSLAFTIPAAITISLAFHWYYKSGALEETSKKVGAETASTFSSGMQGANLDFQIMQTLLHALKNGGRDAEIASTALGLGTNMTAGIMSGMDNEMKKSSSKESDSIFDMIWESLRISFGIHSPAKKMYPIGNFITLGIYEGMKEKVSSANNTINSIKDNIAKGFGNIGEKIAPSLTGIKQSFETMWNDVSRNTNNKFQEIKQNTTSRLTEIDLTVSSKLLSTRTNVNTRLTEIKTNFATRWTEVKTNTSSRLSEISSDVQTKMLTMKSNFQSRMYEISSANSSRWSEIVNVAKNNLDRARVNLSNGLEQAKYTFNSFRDSIANSANILGTKISDAFAPIGDKFQNNVINVIKNKWNAFASHLNDSLSWYIPPLVVKGKTLFSGTNISLGRVPTFANGGFPEDGWFRASHGEMMGKFDNGQSVVANNMQIIEGIKQGVTEAMMEVIMATSGSNNGGSVEIPIYMDGREIARGTAKNIDDMIRGGQLRPSWI